jgi:oligopeptide/dipeptide ABC transporter ATP-binding protein
MKMPTASLAGAEVSTEREPDAILRVEHLRKEFARRSLTDRVRGRPGVRTLALDDVSLSVASRDALAIVGESGSGKTTLAQSIVRLVTPDSGHIHFGGRDILKAGRGDLPGIRRRIQLVYQDPYSSLNSALSIGDAIVEPALVHGLVEKQDAKQRTAELMDQVGLPATFAKHRPRALSGGQRQRVAIARALAAQPEILIADEAVSALDVSVQAQVIRLFARLREELGLTLIFVSHQLATVAQLCERVAIMYRGRLVELGPTGEVFAQPRHGYTAALINAHPGGRRLRARAKPDEDTAPPPPPPIEQPGCPFQHRCLYVADPCRQVTPPITEISPQHQASCHILPQRDELASTAGIHAHNNTPTRQHLPATTT